MAGLVFAAVLFVLPGLAAESETEPEFYFTRLVYGNGSAPARTPVLIFDARTWKPARAARGLAADGAPIFRRPTASSCGASSASATFGSMTRVLTSSPLLTRSFSAIPTCTLFRPHRMYLVREEAAKLREYLLRGGFLHVDDFWGLEQRRAVEEEMGKIFPDRQIVKLSLDHEVFHTFFDIETVMQIPNVNNACSGRRTWEQRSEIDPMIFGISDDDGRLMVLITYNSDLGDAWEWMDLACYPQEYSGQAYRMGLNFMIYAMSH